MARSGVGGGGSPTGALDTGVRPGALAALRVPAYRAWFASQVLSASGLITQSVALSWLILQTTGNALWLAALTSCSLLPVLFGSAHGGALVDRHDTRRVLLVTQTAFLSVALVLFAVVAGEATHLAPILACAVAAGCIGAVDGAARQVYGLELVGRDRAASAVGLYEVLLNASRVLGPALGGILLATTGAPACILVNGLTYLAPLAVLIRHRRSAPRRGGLSGQEDVAARAPRSRGGTAAGLRYVWRRRDLRALVLLAAASGVLFNTTVLFPLLARQAFGLSGGGYGVLLACFGIGAVPGALLAAGQHGEVTGRRVRTLAAGTALAMVATALAPTTALAFPAMALTGLLSIWFIATANTLAQLRADPALRGRVMGIWTMALPGTNPISTLAAAAVAQAAGARAGFVFAAALIATATAVGWRALSTTRA